MIIRSHASDDFFCNELSGLLISHGLGYVHSFFSIQARYDGHSAMVFFVHLPAQHFNQNGNWSHNREKKYNGNSNHPADMRHFLIINDHNKCNDNGGHVDDQQRHKNVAHCSVHTVSFNTEVMLFRRKIRTCSVGECGLTSNRLILKKFSQFSILGLVLKTKKDTRKTDVFFYV
jgi:hypothetical protein